MIKPVLVGSPEQIEKKAQEIGVQLSILKL